MFIAGATGYVGGRLAPALLARGRRVRCLARAPRKLDERPWRDDAGVEVVQGDVEDQEALAGQLAGCRVAYYLIHTLASADEQRQRRDVRLAKSFAHAAAAAGVQRIIYLGGLGELGEGLNSRFRKRPEVEAALASTGVCVTTLRVAMIIGAGSAAFEMLRYLVERLPVMITPRWVEKESQPIAIADVLYWLVQSLESPEVAGERLELGGPDVLSYRDLMQLMAEELHLRRRMIFGVPLLTPRLSSAWISLITPVTYNIARPLAESLRNRVVVASKRAQQLMPHQPISVRMAIRQSLATTERGDVPTRWSAAGPIPGDPDWAGGKVYSEMRSIAIDADPIDVFTAVCRVGGGHGWYAADILWKIRGWMDQFVGGPGLRRGRRHPEKVEYGEALDFWRVIGIERGRSLVLHAEMKVPGRAQLEFFIEPHGATPENTSEKTSTPDDRQQTRLDMKALFRPRGLLGILYWYAVAPLHKIVFSGMLGGIKRAAEAIDDDRRTGGEKNQDFSNGEMAGPHEAGQADQFAGTNANGPSLS